MGAPILAFDVGGSFVKAGLVDAGQGRLADSCSPFMKRMLPCVDRIDRTCCYYR